VEEGFTGEIVDEATRAQYEKAVGFQQKQEQLMHGIESQIADRQRRQDKLAVDLVRKVCEFEHKGLLTDYAALLQNQRDLVQEHLDYAASCNKDSDVRALKRAVDQLDEHLQTVKNTRKGTRDKPEWACLMLGVEATATLDEVEGSYSTISQRILIPRVLQSGANLPGGRGGQDSAGASQVCSSDASWTPPFS